MSFTKYMQARDRRTDTRTVAGRFRGGKLAPVMAVPFRESEGGAVKQRIGLELDPVAGRLITEVHAHVVSVFVPALAIDVVKNPEQEYAGNAEMFRDKLTSGEPVFDLEEEGEISKRLRINPRSIDGTKYVGEFARLAHIAAVNYLRRRKYVKAAQLDNTHDGLTPALLSSTALEMLNGVLDPEDRVNGAVSLEGSIPVQGMGTNLTAYENKSIRETGGEVKTGSYTQTAYVNLAEDPDNPGFPRVVANLAGAESLSLQQFYRAEIMDGLTREFRRIIDENPEHGEAMVARVAHGLSVDPGKQPFVVFEREWTLGMGIRSATDGASLDVQQSNIAGAVDFTVPIPQTEFGGILLTFASVKPDETIGTQPHVMLSDQWVGRNYAADELALDPVPVTYRDLDSEVADVDEGTVAMYVGNNHLLRRYVDYGFNHSLDLNDVANKTALWQYQIPLSTTPDSVIYPDDISHYPFADQEAEVVTYTVSSAANVMTPVIFGPTPVEELEAIETLDVFEGAEVVE